MAMFKNNPKKVKDGQKKTVQDWVSKEEDKK